MSERSPSGFYGKVLVQPDRRLQVKYMHLQCSIGRRYSYAHTMYIRVPYNIETTLCSLSQSFICRLPIGPSACNRGREVADTPVVARAGGVR